MLKIRSINMISAKYQSTMWRLWKEFCKQSTVHGLQLVVSERNSSKETKIFRSLNPAALGYSPFSPYVNPALIFWSCLMTAASLLVVGVVVYYSHLLRYSGVELIVSDPNLDLGYVEFPAVTLCHNSKILRRVVDSAIIPRFNLSGADDLEKFYNSLNALDMMKFPFYHHPLLYIKEFNHSVRHIPREQILSIMETIKPKLDDMIENCQWKGIAGDCDDFFREQVTEEGFCYSFNSKTATRRENESDRLPPMATEDGTLVGLRNNNAGRGSGLSFHLKSLDNEMLERNMLTRGYSLMIHDPESFPDLSRKWSIFWKNYSFVRISVKMMTVNADSTLRQLTDSSRGCALVNSISVYACYLSCRKRQIFNDCGCLPYYMYSENKSVPTCGFEDLECLSLNNIKQRNPTSPDDKFDFPLWSIPLTMNCTCIQPCSYTTYTPDIFFMTKEEFNEFHGPFRSNVLGLVEVIYKERYVTSYLKKAQFTLADFAVAVGGLVSLLLGCSVFTLVELIIFLYKFLREAYLTYCGNRRVILPFVK